MPRLILILAVIAILYLLLRRVPSMPPHKRRAEYMKIAGGGAVVLVVMLTLAGKMHWIGAALTGLLVAGRQTLPLLIRFFPLLGSLGASARAQPRHSTVSTSILRMHLDLDSGEMSGEIIEGPFRDWRLNEMNREQLENLRQYCEEHDAESLQLLEGYLEQRFGAGAAASDGASTPDPGPSGMTRQEALEVLGLDDAADEEAIVAAHRKLMQKLHPDRGGSDYLAAKINQAKDFLMGS